MTTQCPTPSPPRDALVACVHLVDKFLKSNDLSELPQLRAHIEALLPDAKSHCAEVAELHDMAATFKSLQTGLMDERIASRVIRNQVLNEPHCRIACWNNLRLRLQRLRALQQDTEDPISAYVRFAVDILQLADDALRWFPDRQPPVKGQASAAWSVTPAERLLIAELLSPRVVEDVHATLLYRAIQAARDRGEASIAIPKLERLDKALKSVAGLLCRASGGTSLMATKEGMELKDASNVALVLVERKPITRIAATADEACRRLGKEWATARELSKLFCRTETSIRSAVNRHIRKLAGIEKDAFRELNLRSIPNPGPHMPEQEYRITGVWPLLFPDKA